MEDPKKRKKKKQWSLTRLLSRALHSVLCRLALSGLPDDVLEPSFIDVRLVLDDLDRRLRLPPRNGFTSSSSDVFSRGTDVAPRSLSSESSGLRRSWRWRARDGVAVVKKSRDPYGDFRRSMVEMIMEGQIFGDDELEALLQCYLSLNHRKHHALILRVFSDIRHILLGGISTCRC